MTSWNINQRVRGVGFWEIALSYTNYDFEYRLAMVNISAYSIKSLLINSIYHRGSIWL